MKQRIKEDVYFGCGRPSFNIQQTNSTIPFNNYNKEEGTRKKKVRFIVPSK
jgi:hypothetical protein